MNFTNRFSVTSKPVITLIRSNHLKMKRISFAVLLIISACSSVRISSVDRDPEFSLGKYKAFGFHVIGVGGTGISEKYQANLDLLKAAIGHEMEKRGVVHSQENPDLEVNIGIVVDAKEQTRELSYGNPADRNHIMYMGSRNYSWQAQEVVVGHYREGSVQVDLIDRNGNKLVWTGTAESVLPDNSKKVPELINEAMMMLFEEVSALPVHN